MLDIPPPPQSEPGSPLAQDFQDNEDILVVPSSDEEQSTVGGGWRLVGRGKGKEGDADKDKIGKQIGRSRTTVSRSGGPPRLFSWHGGST